MRYFQLFAVQKTAQLSPESLAQLIGISGMTLRRWTQKNPQGEIPRIYIPAIRQACYELIAAGKIPADSEETLALLQGADSVVQRAAGANLGSSISLDDILRASDGTSSEPLLEKLVEIGLHPDKQATVSASADKIAGFSAQGRRWAGIVGTLWEAVRSPRIPLRRKCVAFGALFYLLTPIDLIPDYTPVVGLLDDYIVVAAAAAYCVKDALDETRPAKRERPVEA